ncbi:hypothetical protein FRACYDRAFT_249532 [Fragilariopsis cylindrus CCMP1102]|uniref:POZ domain-containing protein n=1 Tax=Fragilariopsis cylindrus CCMP1102 TaxID=635003 RepID=A0A1E7ERL8_9STRA|nr:hypothetical protein FRACYDRAFT_249532 [Fragilariopsis cylindrus CCMP1102]|eukprot:OEU08638.1 hypothetical protein FRACYDRAFT_249532 [Fragilariopsis cylindrus CCMP1102]
MAGQKRKYVGTASVGDAPKQLLENVETMRFVFHNFTDLKEERGDSVYTPPLEAFGYLWRVVLYPRGNNDSSSETGYISCYLQYVGDVNYKPAAKYSFRCKDCCYECETRVFDDNRKMLGLSSYLKRKEVLEQCLEADGSLVIDVDLQITADSKRVWYPKKLQREEILVQSYSDSSNTTSDIVFVVEGMDYHAHKMILLLRAKTLYELSKEQYITSDDDQPRVPLSHIKGETFRKILEYIYTVNTTPKLDDVSSAEDLILAADRFDCTQLKLYVESTIVDKFLTTENAASMLVLGDSHSLALLKEAAMNMYASDPIILQESESWSEINESNRLLEELLKFVSLKLVSSKNGETTAYFPIVIQDNATIIEHLDVTTLREQLQDKKLDLDGSREILVQRLKSWWESLPKIIVVSNSANASHKKVDGIYTRDFYSSSDGSPRYSMIGIREGNNCVYSIFRCKTSDGKQYWYLSIVPKGKTPGTSDDIDFYVFSSTGDCPDSPPLTGWRTTAEATAENPPPTLSFSE